MKQYAYYPGCSLESLGKSYQVSTMAVASALGWNLRKSMTGTAVVQLHISRLTNSWHTPSQPGTWQRPKKPVLILLLLAAHVTRTPTLRINISRLIPIWLNTSTMPWKPTICISRHIKCMAPHRSVHQRRWVGRDKNKVSNPLKDLRSLLIMDANSCGRGKITKMLRISIL